MNIIHRQMAEAGAGSLAARYKDVRARTDALTAPLSPEDQVVQSMPDASPAKWHRAHTTWFFETFLLLPFLPGYRRVRDDYAFLFNSYYEAAGPRYARPMRGMLTRPSCEEVGEYRAAVDEAMAALLRDPPPEAPALLELGLQHEEQHQELLLTDILHALGANPLRPAYDAAWQPPPAATGPSRMLDGPRGVVEIGHDGHGFAFDNEAPRHPTYLSPYRIADSLVTNGEWLAFMRDGGYRQPLLWMSEGWAMCQAEGWDAPLYWEQREGNWLQFSLGGLRAVEPDRAGLPHLLVRSRCLCPLGRQAPAHGAGMGSGGHRPARLRRCGRHRLAMDRQRLPPLPRLPALDRGSRRVQRQVHDQPDGAARRLPGHAAGAYAAKLP
jgi:ergothioneine biosynthesis protein EgtB